jgi:hypothetical protein
MQQLIQIIIGFWIARALPLCIRLSLFLVWRWIVTDRCFRTHYYVLDVPGYRRNGGMTSHDGLTRWEKTKLREPIKFRIVMGPWWFITPENFKKQILSV